MNEVVADTHAILWFIFDPSRLSTPATEAMLRAEASSILVSSLTIVELAYLMDKGRFPERVYRGLVEAIEDPRSHIDLAPVTLEVAQAVRRVPRSIVPDMPDRVIAATALHLGLPLVTADSQIRSSGVETIW